jgi:transcriptional regulator of acetoin/glycerol metabolism
MSGPAERGGGTRLRLVPSQSRDTERLVVVRRDHFAAFAVLAQAYAGEPGVRVVWDRRRRERRGTASAIGAGDRRQRDRRASAALAENDYVVFTREQLREPGAMAFVRHCEVADAARHPTVGDDVRREFIAAAESELPVLISGGDAISRRSLARRMHDRSGRAARGFLVIDREMFVDWCDNWIRGGRDLEGLAGGTAFIEEVAHWTLEEQAQFSDRLERLARARGTSPTLQRAPLRIVSGSASCLIDLVHARRFGADLFYRLNMVHLVLPSGIVKAMA